MRNLISNAIKFTPPGGSVTIRIRIIAHEVIHGIQRHQHFHDGLHVMTKISAEEPMWLQVDVTDTGHGISTENLPKLFHQIIQFNAGKLQGGGGSGIGLWGEFIIIQTSS